MKARVKFWPDTDQWDQGHRSVRRSHPASEGRSAEPGRENHRPPSASSRLHAGKAVAKTGTHERETV
jgi:hypothetical protein